MGGTMSWSIVGMFTQMLSVSSQNTIAVEHMNQPKQRTFFIVILTN